MKKQNVFTIAVICMLCLTYLAGNSTNGRSGQKGGVMNKPIPADVMKIIEKSCISCHNEPGNFMALSHLNLTNWDKYAPEKQAKKAEAMCTMVTKDKMPPKTFRKNHPDGVPSAEEIKTICNWAASIQLPKK